MIDVKLNTLLNETLSTKILIYYCRKVKVNYWNYDNLCSPFWRLYCPLEAVGELKMENKLYKLKRGKGMLIPANTNISSCNAGNHTFEKIYCHFALDIGDVTVKPGVYIFDISESDLIIISLLIEDLKNKKESGVKLNILMLNLIAKSLALIPEHSFLVKPEDKRINKCIEIMKETISNPLSNNEIAGQVKLQVSRFSELFKHITGESPQKYYMRIRLESACDLLLNTQLTIDEIAERCGFWDRGHFTSIFSKKWYCPPAEFRKRNLS